MYKPMVESDEMQVFHSIVNKNMPTAQGVLDGAVDKKKTVSKQITIFRYYAICIVKVIQCVDKESIL
jgi:hypothetical protein